MNKLAAALALASLGSLSVSAFAYDSSEVYAGASYGKARVDMTDIRELKYLGTDIKERDNAHKLTVGYAFNEIYAVEAFYLDDLKLNINHQAAGVTGDMNTYAYGVTGVVKSKVSDSVNFYGKLGLARMNSKIKATDGTLTVKGSENETAGIAGVGAEYRIDNISLKTEYEFFKKGGDNIHYMSAGISYNF